MSWYINDDEEQIFTRGAYLGGPLLADWVNIIYFGKMQQNVRLFLVVLFEKSDLKRVSEVEVGGGGLSEHEVFCLLRM